MTVTLQHCDNVTRWSTHLSDAFFVLLHRFWVSEEVPGFRLLGKCSRPDNQRVPEQRQVCKFAVSNREHKLSIIMTQPPKSVWAQLCNIFVFPPPLKEEKEANDYKLSADRRYVAFMSNYSKVESFHFKKKKSVHRRVLRWFYCLISAVEAFVHGYILALRHTIWVSANAFLILCLQTAFFDRRTAFALKCVKTSSKQTLEFSGVKQK